MAEMIGSNSLWKGDFGSLETHLSNMSPRMPCRSLGCRLYILSNFSEPRASSSTVMTLPPSQNLYSSIWRLMSSASTSPPCTLPQPARFSSHAHSKCPDSLSLNLSPMLRTSDSPMESALSSMPCTIA